MMISQQWSTVIDTGWHPSILVDNRPVDHRFIGIMTTLSTRDLSWFASVASAQKRAEIVSRILLAMLSIPSTPNNWAQHGPTPLLLLEAVIKRGCKLAREHPASDHLEVCLEKHLPPSKWKKHMVPNPIIVAPSHFRNSGFYIFS